MTKILYNKKGNAVGIPSQGIKNEISKSGVVKKNTMKNNDRNGKVVYKLQQVTKQNNKFELHNTKQSNFQSRDFGFDDAKITQMAGAGGNRINKGCKETGKTDVGDDNVQNKCTKKKNRKTKKSKANKTNVEAKHGNKPVPEEQRSGVSNRRYFGIL